MLLSTFNNITHWKNIGIPVSGNVPETMMICHMFFMWLSNFLFKDWWDSLQISYAVLLQYRAEFPSRVGYQLGDVSNRFPKISIGGLKWIFPLQEMSCFTDRRIGGRWCLVSMKPYYLIQGSLTSARFLQQ